MKKEQVFEIYLTRALAILGVLLVHATSYGIVELNTQNNAYPLYNAANIFFKFGTPTFIFLSSFVLFYNYYDRPITWKLLSSFYKKRLLYIILPYFVFSVVYYLYSINYYSSIYTNLEMLQDFTMKFLTGTASSHLYFVFISIQLYLLFPLLLLLAKKVKWFRKYAIVWGFVIQWGFILLNSQYFQITNKGVLSVSYMSYYFLGIYVGIYFNEIKHFFALQWKKFNGKTWILSITTWIMWILASYGHIKIFEEARANNIWVDALWYEFYWNAHTFLSAIILVQLSYIIQRSLPTLLKKPLYHLGVVSFGVYLIHILILNLYQTHIPSGGGILDYGLKTFGAFIVTLGVSWLIVGLTMKYFKFSWVLFGSKPRVIPYK